MLHAGRISSNSRGLLRVIHIRTYIFVNYCSTWSICSTPQLTRPPSPLSPLFRKYLIEAGLDHKGYTVHSLRHTYASELLNAGMRLEVLQQLLGHQDIEMTRRYARLTDRTREEEYFRAMAKIEKGADDGND